MSTECEYCKFKEGDCGYHHKNNGITNYNIASLSACDQYGNCMFFKRKECNCNNKCIHYEVCGIRKETNNKEWFCFAYREERPTGEWIDTGRGGILGENGEIIPHTGIEACSLCCAIISPLFNQERNYCPNCGAKMKEEEEE